MPIRPILPQHRANLTSPAVVPRLPPRAMPSSLGADIFERLVPEQSQQRGVPLLNACGISVPRGGLFDREMRAIKDSLFFAVLFGVPAFAMGVTMSYFIIFHVAFMGLYESYKRED